MSHILSAIPGGLGREEWLHALPRALVAGFVKTDKEFQSRGMNIVLTCLNFFLYAVLEHDPWSPCFSSTGQTSGTTATFVIIDGWTVTVASVGDSRCILDAQGGAISALTVDHRLEENIEE